jgi:hypothetical protein
MLTIEPGVDFDVNTNYEKTSYKCVELHGTAPVKEPRSVFQRAERNPVKGHYILEALRSYPMAGNNRM